MTPPGLRGDVPHPLLCLTLSLVVAAASAKDQAGATSLVEVSEHKDFKKLLKTKNNLLVTFSEAKLDGKVQEMLTKVSKNTKGKGTLVRINCQSAAKLCKKLKVSWP